MSELPGSIQHIVAQLKRRHVFRVALVYTVVSWVAMQVASVTFPALHLPPWTLTLVVVLLLAGFPVALLLAWAFEITPDGVRRTRESSFDGRRLVRPSSFVGVAVVLGLVSLTSLFLRADETADPNRVVVVPFENRTGDETLDPIGQMTADGITQQLARTGLVDLAVVPDPGPGRPADTPAAAPEAAGNGNGAHADAGIVVTGAYYLDSDRLLFQAQVTDGAGGQILSAIDPASSTRDGPRQAIELLGQRVAGVMAVLFDPRLEDRPRRPTFPSPRFGAYTEMRKGLDRLYASDFDGAIQRFEKASRVDTAFLQPLLVRGAASVFLQRYAEADSIRRALVRAPDGLTPLELVQAGGLEGLLAGDWEGFREAWEGGPDLAPSLNAFLQAWAALRGDRPADAVAILEPLHPDRGGLLEGFQPFWDVLTSALHAAGRHRRELAEARRAAEYLPPSPLVTFMVTRALAASERPVAALEWLRNSAEVPAGRTPWRLVAPLPDMGAAGVATARELRTHEHPEAAADALRFANAWYEARAEDDGDPPSPQALADLAYVAGDMDRALERLEPLDLREAGVFATRLRGTIAALLGDTATAEEALARLDADSTADVMGRHTFACAVVAYFLGRDEKALELLGTARERGYDVTTALHLEPDLARLAEKARARGAPAPQEP